MIFEGLRVRASKGVSSEVREGVQFSVTGAVKASKQGGKEKQKTEKQKQGKEQRKE